MNVERYRIVGPVPSHLDYLTASYVLEVVRQPHEIVPLEQWVFRARKENTGSVCVIAAELVDRSRLLERLADGFEVEAGTPAAKVMERLVREGVAQKSRPGRR